MCSSDLTEYARVIVASNYDKVGHRWANTCRYKGELKLKDYMSEWDESKQDAKGLLSCLIKAVVCRAARKRR